MDICGDEALFVPLDDCECPSGGGPAIESVTWAQLKALRDGSDLVPGMQYRIVDYECTTTQAGTTVAPHPFDIIVVADSASVLNENARAILHKGDTYYTDRFEKPCELNAWEIKYSIDNQPRRFSWADPVNGKGVIYYMKDEHGNEAPYDFKQIQFVRYQIDAAGGHAYFEEMWATQSAATEFLDPITLGSTPTYFYTFSRYNNGTVTDLSVTQMEGCFENSLRLRRPEVRTFDFDAATLPDIVFIEDPQWYTPYNTVPHGITKNTIGANSSGLTFHGSTHNNDLGENVRDSVFLMSFVDNTIGDYCYGLFIGHQANDNTIGASCHTFLWDGLHPGNVVGPWCEGIVFAPVVGNNTIDSSCAYISLGNYSGHNMIHSGCWYILLEDTCAMNEFGPGCYNITSESGITYNSFGSYCHDITFATYHWSNSFGNDCAYIDLEDGVIHCTFEDGVQYVRITTSDIGYDQCVQNYYFLSGVQGTALNYIEIPGTNSNVFTTYVGRMSDGTLRLWNPADVTAAPQIYQGPINVTPMVDTVQTLSTAGMLLEDDITVQGIPYTETPNAAGGTTLTIG